MKNLKFWLIAATMIAVLGVFTSCEKEPEHIDTEVLDVGMSDAPTLTVTENGTIMEYETWINYNKIMTRAGSTTSVPLRNEFLNGTDEITVGNFYMGELSTSFSIEEINLSAKYDDVTVYDYGYVFSVEYENYSYDHPFLFQKAAYEDGVVSEDLPYYEIESVEMVGEPVHANIGVIQDEIDGCFYARKKSTHNVIVKCNGEEFPAVIDVISKYLVSRGEPYVNNSSTAKKWVTHSDNLWVSHLEMNQTMSTGEEKVRTYDVPLIVDFNYIPINAILLPDVNIVKESEEVFEVSTALQGVDDLYIHDVYNEQILAVKYNHFDVSFRMNVTQPMYEDGITSENLATVDVKNVVVTDWIEGPIDADYYGTPADMYDFYCRATAVINGETVEAVSVVPIFVKK